MEHTCHRGVLGSGHFRLRNSPEHKSPWNNTGGCFGHRHLHRLQHDWRWGPYPHKTGRSGNHTDNHSYKFVWERALPTTSHANPAASHLVLCATILLLHMHTADADRAIAGINFTRFAHFGINVCNYFARRLPHLCLVLENGKKTRNAFVVLKTMTKQEKRKKVKAYLRLRKTNTAATATMMMIAAPIAM